MNKIESKMIDIDNENDIKTKYENIIKLQNMIENEENKIDKLYQKLENSADSKYDDLELEQIILKFNKTDNIEKRIKYYYSISNKIDNIIRNII